MTVQETGDTFEQVLSAAADSDEAHELAWSRLYQEILVIAGAQRSRWSGDWTMETRVLANEVYIKLFDQRTPTPKSRKHFFALLSKAMRHILVNYSEARRTAKRGGDMADVTLHAEPGIALDHEASDTILELHDALRRFEALDERAAKVVELRFFAGLNYEEIAEAVGVAKATVRRDWDVARAWLNRELAAQTTVSLRLEAQVAEPRPKGDGAGSFRGSDMTAGDAARWQRVKQIFGDLLELPEGERRSAVVDRCGGDSDLEDEVLSLLTSHGVPSSPLDAVGRALAEGRRARSERKDWVGEEVAGHRVVELLGRGGMGSVFRADPVEGGASVAIKLLHEDARSEVSLRRFAKEQEGLRSLGHPYIVKLLEGGTADDGTPYYVMELVDGQPIDQYADAERLTVEDRLRLLLEVCDAVAHAHAHDIVHRDLKPSNILIRRSGEPALVDFGIAKRLDPVLQGAPGEDTGVARAYTVVYASPEQLDGEAVSAASDVYSLAIVSYKLLTSLTPRMRNRTEQGTLGDNLVRIERSLPKVAAGRDTTPAELRRLLGGKLERKILVRACDPSPAVRHQSVDELAADLRRWLAEGDGKAGRRSVGDWFSGLRGR